MCQLLLDCKSWGGYVAEECRYRCVHEISQVQADPGLQIPGSAAGHHRRMQISSPKAYSIPIGVQMILGTDRYLRSAVALRSAAVLQFVLRIHSLVEVVFQTYRALIAIRYLAKYEIRSDRAQPGSLVEIKLNQ